MHKSYFLIPHVLWVIPVMFGVMTLDLPTQAQNTELVTVDVQHLSAGYRASKIIGSDISNYNNDIIGKVDDLIINTGGSNSLYVVISIGDFLNTRGHFITVPYSSLTFSNKKILLGRASKDELLALPAFNYVAN